MKTRFTILIALVSLSLITCTQKQVEEQIKAVPVSNDRLEIITPVTPAIEESYAAEELQKYIEKITGSKIKITNESSSDEIFSIHLGRTEKGISLKPEKDKPYDGGSGFRYKSISGGLVIIGADPLSTLYGVYDLLEDYNGVRWFMPGEIGEVVPKSSTLSIPVQIDRLEKPDIPIRWIGRGDWALKNRMNVGVEIDGQPVGVKWKGGFHSFLHLMPPLKYFKDHPEWYGLVKGKRAVSEHPEFAHSWQICTSNPEAALVCAKNFCIDIEQNPDLDIIDLTPNDGGGFCFCEHCAGLDEERDWWGTYSDRLAPFNGTVARVVGKKFPGKLIKTGAYAMYVRYPADPDYKPEKNMAVQACHTYACYTHSFTDPDCEFNRELFTKDFDKWSQNTNHLFVYEYYIKGIWGDLPWPTLHSIREEIPYYHKMGVEAFYTQFSNQKFFVNGLNFYLPVKLIWNSKQDFDALFDDYCQKFYGASADAMKNYFLTLEDAMINSGIHIAPFLIQPTSIASYQVFTPEYLQKAGNWLNKAEQLAENDLYKKRIHLSRISYNYCSMTMKYLTAIGEPFKGIDENDKKAMEIAAKKAEQTGELLSKEIKEYLMKELPFYKKTFGKRSPNSNPIRSAIYRLLNSHTLPNRIPEIGLRKPPPTITYLKENF